MSEVQAAAPQAAAPAEAPQSAQEGQVQGQEALSQEAQSAAQKAAEQKRINKVKLKFNQQEVEEELPFEIPDDPKAVEYITKQLQMAKLGHTSRQQLVETQREVQAFLEELRSDPLAALQNADIGIDIKQAVAKYIEKELEEAQKSPEQLAREKELSELKAAREERDRLKAELESKEQARLFSEAQREYNESIDNALAKYKELPRSDYVIKKIANYMLEGVQQGIDVTPEDVLPLVKDEIEQEVRGMLSALSDEQVENIVGKEVFNRMRRKRVADAKAKQSSAAVKAPSKVEATGKSEQVKVDKSADSKGKQKSFKDFFGI